jgi:hypothetical protein
MRAWTMEVMPNFGNAIREQDISSTNFQNSLAFY